MALAQPKPIELRYTSGAPPKGNPWVDADRTLRQGRRRREQGRDQDPPFFGLAARQRAGHGAAGGARAHRHGRLLGRRGGAGRARGGAAADALLLPQRGGAGLRARQPHDQAGDRRLRQEGRAVPRLGRSRQHRHVRQEAADGAGRPERHQGRHLCQQDAGAVLQLAGRQRQPARPAGMDPGLPDRHGRRGDDADHLRPALGADQGGAGGVHARRLSTRRG